jgi:hydrogenase nickel incorporation protein HypA/HybF
MGARVCDPQPDALRLVLSHTTALREHGMHEVSIMAEAVRMAVESAQTAGARHVTGLRLRVGTLSGAVPEAMRFAWDVVTRDTIAAGARLEFESVPGVGWCDACGAEFDCADFFNECPRCHNVSGELRRGRELEIASVEMI